MSETSSAGGGTISGQVIQQPLADQLAAVLAEVTGRSAVPTESHFFDDLGADSLVMAHFCAKVRKREDLPAVSMKDVYRNPSAKSLAAAVEIIEPVSSPVVSESVLESVPVPAENNSRWQMPVCGMLQLLIFLGYTYLAGVVVLSGFVWVHDASTFLTIYLRSLLVSAGIVGFLVTLPIVAKWMLIGRWQPIRIRVWSLAYVRFWLVRTLVQRNPLVLLFAGSPLYSLYLRALGAKVGKGVSIFTLNVPACTDLLSIGAGTMIGKDAFLNCYRAHDGMIETGPVTLGRDVFIGEVTVLDIETAMGDGAQLGHSSSLQCGQSVPSGERWHGTPAQPTDVDYRLVGARPCGTLRRAAYATIQLLMMLTLASPLALGAPSMLLKTVPQLKPLLDPEQLPVTGLEFYVHVLELSLLLYVGLLLFGLVMVATVPRLLNLALEPGRTYPLYGVHYSLHRTVTALTNVKTFTFLFGDSSYIVGYLRWVGYNLTHAEQTGSNFGQAVKHENPYLTAVGSGTMVADGLSVMNAQYSDTSFRLLPTTIGARSFLGNRIAYPAGARTGDNVLLATKVMVPIDGPMRENVGLLGSPPFEIPRTVQRDNQLDVTTTAEFRARLRAKNAHNLVTMALHLGSRWMLLFLVTLVAALGAAFYPVLGATVMPAVTVLSLFVSVAYFVLLDRSVSRLQLRAPDGCSIYDVAFWRHERYWKLATAAIVVPYNGTPFKNVVWRLLGLRLGRGVFDDGCGVTERVLASIGDGCTLNAGSTLQSHSQEDGAFKSDHISVGAGCTLGVGAFLHYGSTVGDGAVLAADCFLMKGEDVPAQAHWGGNPARPMPARVAAPGETVR
ncbi:MAG: Pls/PosA family non-ribosomal peptide synthetase [Nocardioidaceae bacterium]